MTEAVADYLTMQLHQFDESTLSLYYGPNASSTPGVFGVKAGARTTVEKAVLVVIVDGDVRVGFYAPRASIRRDESIQLATDEFGAFPIRATFLAYETANLFEWISEDTLGGSTP